MAAETIFALASGRGRAGIAVVRISGAAALAAAHALVGAVALPARRLTRVRLRDGRGEPLDDGLAVAFPAPASFTGEDVVELHLHGGGAVVAGVLAALASQPGLRPAEAGEFSRRAFANGKFDLTAAEGLADLIAAETAQQRRQALRQVHGSLSTLYDGWRTRLVAAQARLEACLDFADEDIPAGLEGAVAADVAALAGEIARHLDDSRRGERLRAGLAIAIAGAPNAGKSSLFNALIRRDAAIVSPEAGTTRDVIEAALDLDGYPALLADTAGLRDGGAAIEAEGVRRARRRLAEADLRIVVFDGAGWPAIDAATAALLDADSIAVVSKADLGGVPAAPVVAGRPALAVSARSGAGIARLLTTLSSAAAARLDSGAAPVLTRVRHRSALERCLAALGRGAACSESELAAEELRAAADALGTITGRIDVEGILDVVFRDFCIGK